ncbi:MAG: tetratricopeptide repeat protein [Planctomycetota bacterium]|jgi:tetratricopeptide (TPR) repeat protein|nr:tetratricopeptide repeat protein [Planctomycetota bacterium]
MGVFHGLALVLGLAVAGILLVRHVNLQVDRGFRNLALAVENPEFRRKELARLTGLLAGFKPPPPETAPPDRPLSGMIRALPPVFCLLGGVALAGSLSAGSERAKWLRMGLAMFVPAAAAHLLTRRRRQGENAARRFRLRADLRRLDRDRRGAAEDLENSLRLAPWDDSSWAELAGDLALIGRPEEAAEAVRRARELDPGYEDYRLLEVSLLLRLGRLDRAEAALGDWPAADPRRIIFRAALELARGRREAAEESLRRLAADDPALDLLSGDPALAGLEELLPTPGGREDSP